MSSIKIKKSKKKIQKKFEKQEIINKILHLKMQPLTDYNKLQIQHLQQKLDYI